jgi:hypothetical protein
MKGAPEFPIARSRAQSTFSRILFLTYPGAFPWHLLVIPFTELIRCHALRNLTLELEVSGFNPRNMTRAANPMPWRYLYSSIR